MEYMHKAGKNCNTSIAYSLQLILVSLHQTNTNPNRIVVAKFHHFNLVRTLMDTYTMRLIQFNSIQINVNMKQC